MYHILYLSSAVQAMSVDALQYLLDTSRRNNRRDGITGVLLYLDGNFLQYIEGPRQAMDSLFANIRRDARHRGILVLGEETSEARVFSGWSMGFQHVDTAASGAADLFKLTREALDERLPPHYPRVVTVFMKAFYRANAPLGGRR